MTDSCTGCLREYEVCLKSREILKLSMSNQHYSHNVRLKSLHGRKIALDAQRL